MFRTPLLKSAEAGELLSVRIRITPRLLEELLEALAAAPFPINPELEHGRGGEPTEVQFPLYEHQVDELRDVLAASGFSGSHLEVKSMTDELALSAEYESYL
jgi:hypothetical protein